MLLVQCNNGPPPFGFTIVGLAGRIRSMMFAPVSNVPPIPISVNLTLTRTLLTRTLLTPSKMHFPCTDTLLYSLGIRHGRLYITPIPISLMHTRRTLTWNQVGPELGGLP